MWPARVFFLGPSTPPKRKGSGEGFRALHAGGNEPPCGVRALASPLPSLLPPPPPPPSTPASLPVMGCLVSPLSVLCFKIGQPAQLSLTRGAKGDPPACCPEKGRPGVVRCPPCFRPAEFSRWVGPSQGGMACLSGWALSASRIYRRAKQSHDPSTSSLGLMLIALTHGTMVTQPHMLSWNTKLSTM